MANEQEATQAMPQAAATEAPSEETTTAPTGDDAMTQMVSILLFVVALLVL